VLNDPVGYLFYRLLRNDWSWRLLSADERKIVADANYRHNTLRPDYADPALYGAGRIAGGENWDSPGPRDGSHRGAFLARALDTHRPSAVLEIGPGAGFFTRDICLFDSVKEYCAVDINPAFLEYLAPRLQAVGLHRTFNYQLVEGDHGRIPGDRQFDLIVLLSSVHHIPDRVELFRSLLASLAPGGVIVCHDPSHYLPRLRHIMRKMRRGQLAKRFYLNRDNVATHNMCSLGEYSAICRRVGACRLIVASCRVGPRSERAVAALPRPIADRLRRILSDEIGVVIRRQDSQGRDGASPMTAAL